MDVQDVERILVAVPHHCRECQRQFLDGHTPIFITDTLVRVVCPGCHLEQAVSMSLPL